MAGRGKRPGAPLQLQADVSECRFGHAVDTVELRGDNQPTYSYSVGKECTRRELRALKQQRKKQRHPRFRGRAHDHELQGHVTPSGHNCDRAAPHRRVWEELSDRHRDTGLGARRR